MYKMFFFLTLLFFCLYVTQHIERYQVVGRLDFELWGCKGKISQNIVPVSILRFHILCNLHYFILKLLKGFGSKTIVFHVKIDL